MPLFNNVKYLRELTDVNQTDLAKICGVSRQTISSIERGDYHPSIVLALKIAKYFNVTVEEVFKFEEEINEKQESKKRY